MNDCNGVEIQINDRVACNYRHYLELKVGHVVGFTPQKVKVMLNIRDYKGDFEIILKDPTYVGVLR